MHEEQIVMINSLEKIKGNVHRYFGEEINEGDRAGQNLSTQTKNDENYQKYKEMIEKYKITSKNKMIESLSDTLHDKHKYLSNLFKANDEN
jgi:hypothetical protein